MSGPEHSNDLEHRLTVVEVKQDDHSERLKTVEDQMITPRDIRMMIAGIGMIVAALAGKLPWQDVLAAFAKP